jgi:hypothetical protein
MKSANTRELLWQSFRYTLAFCITTCVIFVIPAFFVIVGAAAGSVVGIVLAGLFFMGGDPPILGLIAGLSLSVVSILIGVSAVLLLAVFALFLSGAIVTPLALMIRLAFTYWHVHSRPLAAAAFCLFGAIVGLILGIITYQLIMLANWNLGNQGWTLIGLSVIGTIVGVVATTIYGSVLLAVDVVRTFVHGIRQDLAKKRLMSVIAE